MPATATNLQQRPALQWPEGQRAQELRLRGREVKGTASPASGAHRNADGNEVGNGNVNVNELRMRACQQKEGQETPEGDRLTTRTDSEGENPMDGARVEKTWQVTEAGVQRNSAGKGQNSPETARPAWNAQRRRAQAEQAALHRGHANPGR